MNDDTELKVEDLIDLFQKSAKRQLDTVLGALQDDKDHVSLFFKWLITRPLYQFYQLLGPHDEEFFSAQQNLGTAYHLFDLLYCSIEDDGNLEFVIKHEFAGGDVGKPWRSTPCLAINGLYCDEYMYSPLEDGTEVVHTGKDNMAFEHLKLGSVNDPYAHLYKFMELSDKAFAEQRAEEENSRQKLRSWVDALKS